MYSSIVKQRLQGVEESLMLAAARSGRDRSAVRLIAVTKGHGPEAVEAVLAVGVRDIGENRVEALEQRVRQFSDPDICWHMIGHLQSRKAAQAGALADVIHSVDSVRLAGRLSRACEGRSQRQQVLIQVNTSGETTKGGLASASAVDEIGQIAELEWLDPVGLMTMAPFTDDETAIRSTFQSLRRLQEEAATLSGFTARELSMGMSNDYLVAVEEGSTMVRLGTALLGERQA